jgi:thymidine phosphorylase
MRTEAVITDMDTPLGRAVGNALEIVECIETMKGRGPGDLVDVVTRVGARMLVLGGAEPDLASGADRVAAVLSSGAAVQTFARLLEAQGGNPRVVDRYDLLPAVPDRETFRAARSGFITAMRAGAIGRASHALGAGRDAVGEPIDHAVGVVVLAKRGDEVRAGQPIVELRHRSGRGLAAALTLVREAVTLGDAPPPPRPNLIAEVT